MVYKSFNSEFMNNSPSFPPSFLFQTNIVLLFGENSKRWQWLFIYLRSMFIPGAIQMVNNWFRLCRLGISSAFEKDVSLSKYI